MSVARFDNGVESLIKIKYVTPILPSNNPIIRYKAGLVNLAEELGIVSRARKIMGIFRDTPYRYNQLVEVRGIDPLFDKVRRAPILNICVNETTEQTVVDYASEFPAKNKQ